MHNASESTWSSSKEISLRSSMASSQRRSCWIITWLIGITELDKDRENIYSDTDNQYKKKATGEVVVRTNSSNYTGKPSRKTVLHTNKLLLKNKNKNNDEKKTHQTRLSQMVHMYTTYMLWFLHEICLLHLQPWRRISLRVSGRLEFVTILLTFLNPSP